MIVGDGKGVWKTRTVHRKPHSERWDPKAIDLVRHPPWRTCDDDPNADGEMPQGVKLETLTGHKFQEIVEDEQSMPRRVYLNKNDFEEHGYSSGCPGCRAILKGIRRQGHSEACRQRIQKALEGTERLERARTREIEFFEEVFRREDKKRKLAEKLLKEADEGAPPTQRVEDDTMGANDDSGNIAGLAARPGQASSSSELTDEDRKRVLAQSQQREAKNRKVEREAGTLKRKREDGRDEDEDDSRQRRDEAMVGEFEVNQEADDLEDEGEIQDYQEDVYDNRTGELLDAKLTKRAENEEMTYMEQLEVGIESTEEECLAKTGKAPVTTKWVRVNKGTSSNPFIRAGLVARDFKTKGGESLFVAMPPLEAKKLLFRMAAKEQHVWRRGRWGEAEAYVHRREKGTSQRKGS